MVKLVPVTNCDALELRDMLMEVVNFLQTMNFTVLVVLTDNNRINQKMFRLLSSNNNWFPNPMNTKAKIFLKFDSVHIQKCWRNNWTDQKNDLVAFRFPLMEAMEKGKATIFEEASFKKLRKHFLNNSDKLLTKGYRLTYKCLYPNNFDKQNVKLIDQLLHESTIASLKDDDSFNGIVCMLEYMKKWWDIHNVKTKFNGIKKRKPNSEPFYRATYSNDERLRWLKSFVVWLKEWNNHEMGKNAKLTNDTYNALLQSTECTVEIINYIFETFNVDYILTGKFNIVNYNPNIIFQITFLICSKAANR